MAESESRVSGMVVAPQDPLIGLLLEENGREVVRYFADEASADATLTDETTKAALSVIGALSDLDWDELVAGLDRIRHESKPTPPIAL